MTQQYPPQYPSPQPPPYGQPDPRQWQNGGYPSPTSTPPPKKRPRWPWILGGLFVVLFVIPAIANSGKSTPDTPTSPTTQSAPAPSAPVPAASAPAAQQPAQPPTPAAAPAPQAPVQSGPATTFSSGTYEVGTDIAPGKYKTKGPDGGDSMCYWARLKDTSGDTSSIIANGDPEGPTVVTISKSDAAFETSGCTWTKAA